MVAVAGLAVALLRLLFLFLTVLALLLLFISFAPSVNKVFLFLRQLRGDAGGGGLDGGRPFFQRRGCC